MADHKEKSSESSQHDHVTKDGEYKKICHCYKCQKTYNDWCKKQKHDGKTRCERKCYTVCEIKCEKEVVTEYKWGETKRYEGEWKAYKPLPVPKKCNSCHKHECSCKDGKKDH